MGTHHRANKSVLLKQLAKPFGFLLLFIMVCAFLAQYLTGSETLAEYAQNNPDLAYSTTDEAPEPSTASDNVRSSNIAATENNAQAPDASMSGNNVPAPDNTVTPENNATYTTDKNNPEEPPKMSEHPERTTYQPGFYYEPLTDTVKQKITGISYPESGCTVPYEDLQYVGQA